MQSESGIGKTQVKNLYIKKLLQSPVAGALIAFILVFIIMSVTGKSTFLSGNNMMNIIRQGAVLSVVAIGQSFVIISGGIDLSVAPLISLSTVITASLITNSNVNWGIAALAAIAACGALGLINGILISYVKIPPIIATLATSMAIQGISLLYSKGYGINLPAGHPLFKLIARGKVAGFPVSGIFMILLYLAAFIVLRYTKFGRVTYGLGGNTEAVYLSGISVTKYKILVYTISAAMAGLAGIVLTGRINSGHPYNGDGMDMNSIAAVVLGGASVAGGTGVIEGTLIGVFILTMIENGLNMINMNVYLQMMIKGLIIVASIGLGSIRENKK